MANIQVQKENTTPTPADPRGPLSTQFCGHDTWVSKYRKLGQGGRVSQSPSLTHRPPQDALSQDRISQEEHADDTFASGV